MTEVINPTQYVAVVYDSCGFEKHVVPMHNVESANLFCKIYNHWCNRFTAAEQISHLESKKVVDNTPQGTREYLTFGGSATTAVYCTTNTYQKEVQSG